MDLPFSPAFLKLLCGGEVSGSARESSTIVTMYILELLENVMTSSLLSLVTEEIEEHSELSTFTGMSPGGRACWCWRILSL